MGTLLVSLLSGGGLAFLPHLFDMGLDFFKQRQANAHELAVMDRQIEAQKALGAQRLEEVKVEAQGAFEVAQENRLAASAVPSGIKWIDGATGLMRPLITILVIANYIYHKTQGGVTWGEADVGMVLTVLIYWMGDRGISKMRAS